MKKTILMGFLLLGLFMTGCKKESEEQNSITVGVPSRIKKLDPMVSNDIPSLLVTNQIFETFTYYGEEGLKSNILSKFFFENNELVLIPRTDLKFSNGDLVTIEDFKNSLERSVQNPGCKFLTGNIGDVRIEGEKLIISFTAPTPSILNNMTYPMIVLLKETENGLIGTGSFKLESEEADTIKLVPNEFSQKPGKRELVLRVITEDNARTMALETGDIQVTTNIPPMDKNLLMKKGIQIVETPSVTTELAWLNNEKLSLEERIKISNAINKEDILNASIEGNGIVANSMIPEKSYGFTPNNLEKKESNVQIDRKIKIIINDIGARKTSSQIIQANLKEVGIDSEIIILDWAKYLESSANGEHDILIGGWVNGTLDAEGVLDPLFHSSNTPAGGRRTMYSNKEFDDILDKSRTYNATEREEYLKKAANKLYNDYAILPLYYGNYTAGTAKNIIGLKGDKRGLYDLSELDYKENK